MHLNGVATVAKVFLEILKYYPFKCIITYFKHISEVDWDIYLLTRTLQDNSYCRFFILSMIVWVVCQLSRKTLEHYGSMLTLRAAARDACSSVSI